MPETEIPTWKSESILVDFAVLSSQEDLAAKSGLTAWDAGCLNKWALLLWVWCYYITEFILCIYFCLHFNKINSFECFYLI